MLHHVDRKYEDYIIACGYKGVATKPSKLLPFENREFSIDFLSHASPPFLFDYIIN